MMTMQTNPNVEKKQVVEVYDWRDFRGDYNPWQKKFYRRLRRKRVKQQHYKMLKATIA